MQDLTCTKYPNFLFQLYTFPSFPLYITTILSTYTHTHTFAIRCFFAAHVPRWFSWEKNPQNRRPRRRLHRVPPSLQWRCWCIRHLPAHPKRPGRPNRKFQRTSKITQPLMLHGTGPIYLQNWVVLGVNVGKCTIH